MIRDRAFGVCVCVCAQTFSLSKGPCIEQSDLVMIQR